MFGKNYEHGPEKKSCFATSYLNVINNHDVLSNLEDAVGLLINKQLRKLKNYPRPKISVKALMDSNWPW